MAESRATPRASCPYCSHGMGSSSSGEMRKYRRAVFLFAAARRLVGKYGHARIAAVMKTAFWNKLIERLDKLDPGSVQAQFLRLAGERGLLETIFHALREGILVLDAEGSAVLRPARMRAARVGRRGGIFA